MKFGGSNREKEAFQNAHEFITQCTGFLVENYDIICMEDLNTEGLLRNRKLAKHIANASWGRIKTQLQYKSEWYGKSVAFVDRYFASSKLDYECGYKNEITLKDRKFTCQGCRRTIDRDLNAAKNIHREGLKNILLERQKTGVERL